MNTLPPPRQPNSPLPSPSVTGSSGRLRAGAIAFVASTLAIGGLVIGSQFVSANSPSLAETVDQPDDNDPAEDSNVDENADDPATPTIDIEHCFFGSGAMDAGPFDLGDTALGDIDPEDIDDLLGEILDGDGAECTSMIPEDLQAEFAAWDDFDKCLDDQLGLDEGFGLGRVGSVTVDVPSEDGFDFSIFDFGENDGSITIVKDGDNISVTTDGDVTELDEFSFGDLDQDFEAAHDACADLLPEGLDLLESTPAHGDFEIFAETPGD